MDYFLAQIILAARDNNYENWMNILFIVVIGVFWVIGGLLKARANKPALKKEEKQPPRKPTRKPPQLEKGLQRQAVKPLHRPPGPAQRRKVVRPRPVGGKIPTETEQAIGLPTLEPLEVSKLEPPRPKLEPELGELPEFAVEAVEKLEAKRVAIPAEILQGKYLSEILLDYDDPDALRMAILHYEILGKPLSLRGPSAEF